jgi:hypothetical protein
MNIIEFIEDPGLINDHSLSVAQKMALKAVYGLPLTDAELEVFNQTTGLNEYIPGKEWTEVSFILGRRSGKSDKLASNIALYEACREHNLSPGQVAVAMIVASEKKRQARIVYDYCLGKLEQSKILKRMIKNITQEEILLTNGAAIQVYPCSIARVRGHSLLCFIGDECAYWKVEGKDIDEDVLNSARPALDFDCSKMIKISTPYMMKGEIYQDFKHYWGKVNDDVLVFRGDTLLFNPSYSRKKLERLKKRKPLTYETEHLANFRTDLSSMFDPLIIDKTINYDRPIELAPRKNIAYRCFVDCAGGGGKDSYAVALGHLEENRVIIDVVRSRAPKFNPDEITAQYCELLKIYGIGKVTGDKFSGDWSLNSFKKNGIDYDRSKKSKSELYLEAESLFNTERIELPNKELLIGQLKNLIRKTRSGGHDSVDADEPEDEANVVVGVVNLLLEEKGDEGFIGLKDARDFYNFEDPVMDLARDFHQSLRQHETGKPGKKLNFITTGMVQAKEKR